MIKNQQKRTFRNWIIAFFAFLFMGIYGMTNFRINSFDGMFIMLSLLMVPLSLVFAYITYKRSLKVGKPLLNWKYTRKEWQDFMDWEHSFRMNEKKIIFFALTPITIFVFLIFILIIPDNKLNMFFVMLGLIFMYFILGFVLPKIRFKSHVGSVIFTKNGVLVGKDYHAWDLPLSRLQSVKQKDKPYYKNKPYKHIKLVYSFADRTGIRSYIVNIPIPKNTNDALKRVKGIYAK